MSEFHGVYVAAVTPRGKQGDVDFGAAFELIDHCCRAGVQGIVLFGDEGEYPAFPVEERSRLIYLAVKRSRVPVIAGVGGPTLDISTGLAREAWDAGAAAVLVPPPFFFRYQPDEIVEFYLQFAKQQDPDATILLYNTPCSASEIPVETATALLASGLFAGIDDARGDARSFACLRAAAENGSFELLSGSDATFIDARSAGCAAVSGAACAVPELCVALDRAIASGNRREAERLGGLLREFLDWAGQFPQPVIVKTATELRGLKTGSLPAPLSPAKQKLLEQFRDWFRKWLPAIQRQCVNA